MDANGNTLSKKIAKVLKSTFKFLFLSTVRQARLTIRNCFKRAPLFSVPTTVGEAQCRWSRQQAITVSLGKENMSYQIN